MPYNVTEKETQPTLWNHINGTPEEILDRHCVAELARGWPVYRDSSEWTHYRDCFAEEGGYIFTSMLSLTNPIVDRYRADWSV
jgi:hypothetical protein